MQIPTMWAKKLIKPLIKKRGIWIEWSDSSLVKIEREQH